MNFMFRSSCTSRVQPVRNSRRGSASRLQLRLADGKSPPGVNSVRSVRQSCHSMYCTFQPHFITGIAENQDIVLQFIPFNGSFWRGTMGKLTEHRNTCVRDVFRNRTCTAVHGRFYNPHCSQVGIGRVTYVQYRLRNALIVNYLNIFISHMFYM